MQYLNKESQIKSKILSVSEINREIRNQIQRNIYPCWVRGEISNLKRQASGHVYFTLKDTSSQIACVLFRSKALKYPKLENGNQIMVWGSISVYEPRGSYQITIEQIEDEGEGRLSVLFQKLKLKLQEKGYFDLENKKAIPAHINKIGIITSETGAVIHDFVRILRNNLWSGDLVLYPVSVQGDESIKKIISAIQKANTHKELDLIVIMRGGGSMEDLWSFNSEDLVYAIYESRLPIISAVGHETDFTLCDFVSDLRCETPSASASYIAQLKEAEEKRLNECILKIDTILSNTSVNLSNRIHRAQEWLKTASIQRQINHLHQKTDYISEALCAKANALIKEKENKHEQLLEKLSIKKLETSLSLKTKAISNAAQHLESLHPQAILNRGFASLRNEKGKHIYSIKKIRIEDKIKIEVQDGSIQATVTSTLST